MSQNTTTDAEELVEQSWRGRTRRMYPEVAQYLRTFRSGERAYEDAVGEADYQFNRAYIALRRQAEDEGRSVDRYGTDQEAYRTIGRARDAAYQEAERARNNSGRDLLLNSPHREVRWIAQQCLFNGQGSEVEGYARDILAVLPATVEEIWTEAKDNRGMCDVFDRFYDQADAAGIFNDGEKPVGAREIAALRNYIRRSYGSSYVRDFMPHVDRLTKAMQEDYDRKLKEVEERHAAERAEWQHLDEAWRSERSRRAAATRAANRAAEETPEPQQAAPKASVQIDFALAND